MDTRNPTARILVRHKKLGIALVIAGLLGAFGFFALGNGDDDALELGTESRGGSWPATPPAQICGNDSILDNGPPSAPNGAITVPAGDNSSMFFEFMQANTTYWFAPGVHTLGDGQFDQIIPGDNSTFVGAPGAVIDGQNLNLLAFTQEARGVTIRYLEIRNFGTGKDNNDQGVVNHNSGADWTIEYNYIHDNDGAGVFIGSGSKIRHNCLKDNGQYGFSAYHDNGVDNVLLDHNEITGNNTDDWEQLRDGCGCTAGGKFWETRGATITNNWVHDNRGTGIWIDYNNSGFLIEGNYIEANEGTGIFYEISYNFMIRNNVIKRNALVAGKGFAEDGDPFPTGGIYISEAGGETRAGNLYAQAEITGNLLEDNWDGIVLWENADRFCRPGEANDTTNTCPPFDQSWGTRYKTQNIEIHNNEFRADKAAIGCTDAYCARMALFSNYGSSPPDSPYLGYEIPWHITFQQDVVFRDNSYFGDWSFAGFESTMPDRSVVTWSEWTAPAPPVPTTFTHDNRPSTFGQDAGSTIQ